MKSFLIADIPLSVAHFIYFIAFGGFLGQPGRIVANAIGASSGDALGWGLMMINSIAWGTLVALIIFPLIRKILN
jgi:hypothetical protein